MLRIFDRIVFTRGCGRSQRGWGPLLILAQVINPMLARSAVTAAAAAIGFCARSLWPTSVSVQCHCDYSLELQEAIARPQDGSLPSAVPTDARPNGGPYAALIAGLVVTVVALLAHIASSTPLARRLRSPVAAAPLPLANGAAAAAGPGGTRRKALGRVEGAFKGEVTNA